MKLTAENVEAILKDCFYKDGENAADAKIVEGVVNKFGFNPERLQSHSEAVKELLHCLPDQFQIDKGGGWSFLQACMTNTGEQWAEHVNVEQLLVLGLATGHAKLCVPRELWQILPGGMPYFVVV